MFISLWKLQIILKDPLFWIGHQLQMAPSCPVDRRPFTNVYRWDGKRSCVLVSLVFFFLKIQCCETFRILFRSQIKWYHLGCRTNSNGVTFTSSQTLLSIWWLISWFQRPFFSRQQYFIILLFLFASCRTVVTFFLNFNTKVPVRKGATKPETESCCCRNPKQNLK